MFNAGGTLLHPSNGVPYGDIRMASKRSKKPKKRNPVAKFARKFNKSRIHRDRTKYWRKSKWRELEKSNDEKSPL